MCPRWQEVPSLAGGALWAQHSCAGGLSQASLCLGCRRWFLGDRSSLVPVRGLVLWGKAVSMTQN